MNEDTLLIASALDFAARKHVHQRRKGVDKEPYVNHLAEVARLLAEATDGADANLVAAGLLHDTIEDQGVRYEELVEAFGRDIADLVREVTDDKTLEKAERKRLQVEHAPHKSERARMLKIADKTSNLRAICNSPPAEWSEQRKREYFDWAGRVVAGCRGVNDRLEAAFDAAWKQGAF
ncbi:MAG: HD domain-containing protein [Gammaproteobacteria bacterium]|nr:HD domain-containing protein [Chloroflexota bacterium]MBM4200005.1 HD domain-containing protein [Gammaproteobacteria bacterium]